MKREAFLVYSVTVAHSEEGNTIWPQGRSFFHTHFLSSVTVHIMLYSIYCWYSFMVVNLLLLRGHMLMLIIKPYWTKIERQESIQHYRQQLVL